MKLLSRDIGLPIDGSKFNVGRTSVQIINVKVASFSAGRTSCGPSVGYNNVSLRHNILSKMYLKHMSFHYAFFD